ncbi:MULTISPECIES: helix-turn-helix domain-containing protein [Acetobacter]|uniref:XRE family transcriptional regulator n=1 Tax=Acetobacter thailandicus TaxID=1502842 RepID=A0ABT3QC30_9PROT|nr:MULTISPECIES: XRE family transcriptional regulator [Acetobacter]MBS0958991.1 helix-turn-helix transcriptional regulator [Acetobacter thailandicus]MBS0980345.1 helix-turn-helix transcriptional regulator [Acetobacter thailandicus]MBS0985122.1 helix-turn-helix transcriptional regulator [Acetobacter thailandicus]MBS1003339.1 helix-turn-helix transcriptional regulator [Acetobacter thailandicus]MCX2562826.1 XRE family transcriptional regulator [Acetobacter thailandicus]
MAGPRTVSAAEQDAASEDLQTGSTAAPIRELTLEESLGAQIRLMRRKLELTGADLASAAGISLGMLSKIENGQISPSLATLQAVCRALNVQLSQLFATFEEQRDCSFVKAGRGVVIERRGTKAGHEYELLGHLLGGPNVVEPYMITLHEEAKPYSSFRHNGVELIYMLSGRVIYRHGDERYDMSAGDTLLFDSQAPHGPEELLEKPMRYLSIIIYPRDTENE